MVLFSYQTYYGVDVNAITDHVRQKALKTMIETYGQTPQQLFNFPHSPRPQQKQQSTQPSDVGSMTSLNTLKLLEIDPVFGAGYFNQHCRLTTSLTSETGSSTGTISGTFATCSRENWEPSSVPLGRCPRNVPLKVILEYITNDCNSR